jgi:hypothetical protein
MKGNSLQSDRTLPDEEVMALIEKFVVLTAPTQALRDDALRDAHQTANSESLDYAGLCESLLGCAFWVATWTIAEMEPCTTRGLRAASAAFARQHGLTEQFAWEPDESNSNMVEEGYWRLCQWLEPRGLVLYSVDTGSDGSVAHFVVTTPVSQQVDAILLRLENQLDCPVPQRYDPYLPPRIVHAFLKLAPGSD